MDSKAFIKDNLMIVVGVSLPLALVLFFLVARDLPGNTVPDPRYDVIFARNYYANQNNRLEFTVDGNRLRVRYFPEKRNEQGYVINQAIPELFYFDVGKNTVRKIPLELPVDEDGYLSQRVQYLEVDAVKNLKIDSGTRSPDGYQLTYSGYRRNGLFAELLVGGGHGNQHVLEKDGRRIPLPGDTYYYNTEVIGWVIGGEGDKNGH